MTDKKRASARPKRRPAGDGGQAPVHDPVPLCRFEELALRENRLRDAAARRGKADD